MITNGGGGSRRGYRHLRRPLPGRSGRPTAGAAGAAGQRLERPASGWSGRPTAGAAGQRLERPASGWNGCGGDGVSVRAGICRVGHNRRGPRMYEMQGPRPVSRHRPADFSASFAPFDHLPGPGTLPVLRSTRSPGGSGTPRAAAQGFLIANKPGFPPSRVAPSTSFAGGSELSFRPMTGVSPKPKAQVFPSPGGSGLSFPHATQSFPFAAA
jgi:hypothetical protein